MSARPLVAVTRDETPQGPLAVELARRGADVLHVPVLATIPVDDPRLASALDKLHAFDWLIFTSRRAALFVAQRGLAERLRAHSCRPRLAAGGRATAEALAGLGLVSDIVALDAEAGAAGLLRALRGLGAGGLAGARVLWPRASGAGRELAAGLAAAGAEVIDPVVYQTRPAPAAAVVDLQKSLERGELAAVTFLSPSAAQALAEGLGHRTLASLHGRTLVASIGPTTSEALRSRGAPPDLEPVERTIPGLAEAVMARLNARSRSHA